MKKLLSSVAIATLLSASAFAGDVVVKANVEEASQVTIGAVADALATGEEVVKNYAMADYSQVIELGATSTTLIDEDVHLRTNNLDSKIQMTLTYDNMTNKTGSGAETIALKCEYDQGSSGTYVEKTSSTAFDLENGAATNTDDHVVGKLKITAIDASDNQVHGNYEGTVVAVIASL